MGLNSAKGIYPEESKTISRSLVGAEPYLPPSDLALTGAHLYILKAIFTLSSTGCNSVLIESNSGWENPPKRYIDSNKEGMAKLSSLLHSSTLKKPLLAETASPC